MVKRYAFFKTSVGAPACAGSIEDTLSEIRTGRYIVFGGSGCLNREIAHGRVMVPTEAYRDEGTSYHYAPPADYIPVRNADRVAAFMASAGIPFVKGCTRHEEGELAGTQHDVRHFDIALALAGAVTA